MTKNIIIDSDLLEKLSILQYRNKNVRINFLGDSITLGRIANPDGTSAGVMEHPYCEYVANRLNCKFINYGVGGSTIMAGTTGYYIFSTAAFVCSIVNLCSEIEFNYLLQ